MDALGTYDAGTEADPIPSTITHEIELNDSATMASNKWGFRTNEVVTNWADGTATFTKIMDDYA